MTYKITINADDSVAELFLEGVSHDIPAHAVPISEPDADMIRAGVADDFILSNNDGVVLDETRKTARMRLLTLTKKRKELENVVVSELQEFGVESIQNLRLVAEMAAKPGRFAAALQFLAIDHFSDLSDDELDELDVAELHKSGFDRSP